MAGPEPIEASELHPEELRRVLSQRLSAALDNAPGAPSVGSDRELCERLPRAQLAEIVRAEVIEIERRTGDLLYPIEASRSPAAWLRNVAKRLVRRMNLHYLLRQTEMNRRMARALNALEAFASRGVSQAEARIGVRDQHLADLTTALGEVRTALADRERELHQLAAQIDRAARALDDRHRDLAELSDRIDGAAAKLGVQLDETRASTSAGLASRDEWIRGLEEGLRATIADVRRQIQERDAWLGATQRDAESAVNEIRVAGEKRDEWLKRMETSLGQLGNDGRMAAIEEGLRAIRADTQAAVETRDQWLRSLQDRVETQQRVLGPVAGAFEQPEDTWIVAVRAEGGPAAPLDAPHAGREAPAETAPTDPVLDLADLRPREKVFEELAPLAERLRTRHSVVDLGCGDGHALAFLETLGVPAVGVDLDPRSVERCRAQGLTADLADAATFLREAVLRGPIDGIVCLHLIEHLDTKAAFHLLEACAEALQRGGLLVLATPNPESLTTQLVHFWRDPGHVRPYARLALERALEHLGFRVCPGGSSSPPPRPK